MNETSESFVFNYKDIEHKAVSIGADRLPNIDEIISVHALPITPEGKTIVVNVRSRGVDMAGGHVEQDETSAIQTLVRELSEEASMTMKNPSFWMFLRLVQNLLMKVTDVILLYFV